jgi:hypothetical protein
MNPRPCLLPLSLALAAFALPAVNRAQTGTPAQPPAATTTGNPTAPQLEPAQLETLLGPVALYPDALIALILPATTAPSDIVLAARFLAANATSLPLETQPWDESVRSLARYPDIIKWLDENLAWTKQLGEVFLAQPAEVMQAIQRLRTRARAAGTLIDTPEQKIVTEGEIILIEPAQPAVIYVPRYDPEIVYVTRSPGWNTLTCTSASASRPARGSAMIATGPAAPFGSATGGNAPTPPGSAPPSPTAPFIPALRSPSPNLGAHPRIATIPRA